MRRTIIVGVALLSGIAGAHARAPGKYDDLIGSRGRPRDPAIHQTGLDFFYNQTGADRNRPDTPAFKKGLLHRGNRWLSAGMAPPPSASPNSSPYVIYNQDSKDPTVGWHWEGGSRVCRSDCDNPEIPGSGFTCRNVVSMGVATRKCTRQN